MLYLLRLTNKLISKKKKKKKLMEGSTYLRIASFHRQGEGLEDERR